MRRDSMINIHADESNAPMLPNIPCGNPHFRQFLSPVAMLYALLSRDRELDWWGLRIAQKQIEFFDKACGETTSLCTGRVVASNEISRLWAFFEPDQAIAAAMALQQAITTDRDPHRLGMKLRIGVGLGEANGLTDPDLINGDLIDPSQELDWNSGCFGIKSTMIESFRLCNVARVGEVLVSHDFADSLVNTPFYCAEHRIAGLDDHSPLALLIDFKNDDKMNWQ